MGSVEVRSCGSVLGLGSNGTTRNHLLPLCKELGITRATLYRYVSPEGDLRKYGERVLAH